MSQKSRVSKLKESIEERDELILKSVYRVKELEGQLEAQKNAIAIHAQEQAPMIAELKEIRERAKFRRAKNKK